MARKAIFDILKANRLFHPRGVIGSASLAAAADGSNITLGTITLKDENGSNLTGQRAIEVFLSDDAAGDGITGTTASGAFAVKTAGTTGRDLTDFTAKKHKRVLTAVADGKYAFNITDTGKTQFYVCVVCPLTGKVFVAGRLLTANYG